MKPSTMTPEEWAKNVADVVRGFVDRKTSELIAKVAHLEARPFLPDPAGAIVAAVANLEETVDAKLAALPAPVTEDYVKSAVDVGIQYQVLPDLLKLEGKVDDLAAVPAPPDLTGALADLATKVAALPAPPTPDDLRPFVEAVIDGATAPLVEKVAALEARPAPDIFGPIESVMSLIRDHDQRIAAVSNPLDVDDVVQIVAETGLAAKVAALEARPAPDYSGAFEVLHQRIAALPPPLTLDAVDAHVGGLVQGVAARTAAVADELTARVASVEARDPLAPQSVHRATLARELYDDLAGKLAADLTAKVAALPPPAKGERGESVTLDDVRPQIDAWLAAYAATWARDFERHAGELLQKAVDRFPRPKDGVDGVDFDDLDMLHDGERTFTFRCVRGERVKEWTFTLPALIDRGVYERGRLYTKGDGATWGGHYWIARRDTDEPPVESGDAWRLAVRRGRDGKGLKGEPGKPGEPGKKGETRWGV